MAIKLSGEELVQYPHVVTAVEGIVYTFTLEVYVPGERNDVYHIMPHTAKLKPGAKREEGDDEFHPMISCCRGPASEPYREPENYACYWYYVTLLPDRLQLDGVPDNVDVALLLKQMFSAIETYKFVNGDNTPDVRTIPGVGKPTHKVSFQKAHYSVLKFYMDGLYDALETLRVSA